MAITEQQKANLLGVTSFMFNFAPDQASFERFENIIENDPSFYALGTNLAKTEAFTSQFEEGATPAEKIDLILGRLGLEEGELGYERGVNFITQRLADGVSEGQVLMEIGEKLLQDTPPEGLEDAAAVLRNKIAVSEAYLESGIAGYSSDTMPDLLAGITADPQSVTDAQVAIDDRAAQEPEEPEEPSIPGETFMLTEGRDVLTGTENDDTFIGLVGQNQNGAVSNAFSTGDFIDGGAGRDKIVASIMEDQEVDSGADSAINARTVNVEEVYLEALDLNGDDIVNVDAGRMDSVEQFWSDNSSADLFIDDVRLGSKLSVTKDVTFGMRDVDTGSSLYAAFDTNSLTREGETQSNSQLLIRVADVTTATPEAPLANVELAIGFTVGSESFTLEGVQSTDGTYQGMQAAVEAALAEQGLGSYTVELANPYNQVTVGGNVVNLPFTAQEILVTDPDGNEFSNTSFNYSAIESVDNEFLVAGNAQPIDPATSTPFIETNLVLDNAGRGSTAGDAVIGGMSNSGQAIQKLNLVVDRDSKVDDITSATGMTDGFNATTYRSFEQIVVTSGENQGDLSIGGFGGAFDSNSDIDGGTNGNGIPHDGIGDTKLFDATAFEGENLSVTGIAISEAAYVYNTADSNDSISVAYDVNDASSSNFSLSIDTGGGNDVVNVGTTIGGTASAAINHFDLANVQVNTGSGDDQIFIGANQSTVNVDAGAGDDFIQVSNSTVANTAQWIFNADTTGSPSTSPLGQGNQTFNVFKAKLQVEFQGITSDVVEVDYSDYVTTSRNINDAIKAAIANDAQLSQLLAVSDLRNEGIQVDSLIHRQLDEGQLNVNFIAPTYDENTNVNNTDFGDDAATLFGERASVTQQELVAAWEAYYPDSEGIGAGSGTGIYAGVANASAMYDALFGELDYSTGNNNLGGYNKEQTEVGANTTETTFNVINGGTGDDMIVLSSREAGGFDTVVFEGNFGNDTIMNFNTGTSTTPGTAADQLDFTAYLDATAAGRGTSVDADERINQQVSYSFANGLNANAAANLANGSIDHNAVVMTGISELFTDFAVNADDRPTSFDAITNAMVERALAANQGWVSTGDVSDDEDMVGSTFVFRLAHDRQIELNSNGEPMVDDFIDAQKEKVFSVTISGWDSDDGFSFSANERGTIEYGDMFSTLANVTDESITGTVDAAESAKKAREAFLEEVEDGGDDDDQNGGGDDNGGVEEAEASSFTNIVNLLADTGVDGDATITFNLESAVTEATGEGEDTVYDFTLTLDNGDSETFVFTLDSITVENAAQLAGELGAGTWVPDGANTAGDFFTDWNGNVTIAEQDSTTLLVTLVGVNDLDGITGSLTATEAGA